MRFPLLDTLRCSLLALAAAAPLAMASTDGEYRIRAPHSNLCLEVAGASQAEGANLRQQTCRSDAQQQRFQVSELGNGLYSLVARHSDKAVEVADAARTAGANVQQRSWSGAFHQQWQGRQSGGNFEIRPRHANALCLEVRDGSLANGANVQVSTCQGSNQQKWKLSRLGDGAASGPGIPATVTVDGAAFSSKSTGGASAQNSWNIWTNGHIEHSFAFSDPSRVEVLARGEPAAGVWPQMQVSVGGTQLGSVAVNSSEWKRYSFDVRGKQGNQPLRIAFNNDYLAKGEDRNLLVRSASVRSFASAGPVTPPPGGNPPSGTPVSRHGQLRVTGPNLLDASGQPVQLRGMSSHGLHWYGQYINSASIKWLRDDWQANVVRAAMYTAEGGYISNPSIKNKVIETVDAAIEHGLYVIIDWHILYDNDPNMYKPQAIAFFREMAQRYGNHPNVIYEIANEPNGNVNWNQHIRPYAMDVISAIRQIDPDNPIIVGTGTWSQDIHHAAENPLPQANVLYALHFYAGTHGQELRNRIDYARSLNAAIFVSEWGSSQASGGGGVFVSETRTWIDFLNQRNLSWVNWSLADKNETSAALAPGASTQGGWSDSQLSPSGRLVRELMRN